MKRRLRGTYAVLLAIGDAAHDGAEWVLGVAKRIERGQGMTGRERLIVGAVHAAILGFGAWLVWVGLGWAGVL